MFLSHISEALDTTLDSLERHVVIPGNLDWYLCDGTAMMNLGAGMFDETWRDSIDQYDYKTNS